MLLFFVNEDDVIKRLKYSDGQTKNIRNFSAKTMIARGSINLFLPIKYGFMLLGNNTINEKEAILFSYLLNIIVQTIVGTIWRCLSILLTKPL